MCGRYYIEEDDRTLLQSQVFARLKEELGAPVPRGEIFPTQAIPVFVPGGAKLMHWGFSGFQGKTVINARSETVLERQMFAPHVFAERVIIPASGFFEWKKTSGAAQKHAIFHPDEPMLMAGLCRTVQGRQETVILTRAAQGGMEAIHDRMPLLFTLEEARQWIARRTDRDTVCALLEAQAPRIILKDLSATS